MPKIIPQEMKFLVISLFYLGYSRDEIAAKTDLSEGTVSNYLTEFRKEIGNKEFEAIKTWGRFLKKHKIEPENAPMGIRMWNMFQRYNLKEDDMNSLVEDSSTIVSSSTNISKLFSTANQLIEIKIKTGKSYQATLAEFDKLSKAMPVLEKKKQDLESVIQILQNEQNKMFNQNKTTEKELRQFTVTKSDYNKIGLRLEDLPKYHKALVEIKHLGYDVAKVLSYIKEIASLEKHIDACKQTISKYNQDIETLKKQYHSISKKLEQIQQEYQQQYDAIRVIIKLRQNKQDPSSIIQWNKILKQNNMTLQQFDKKLHDYDGLIEYLTKIANEIISLKKQQKKLQSSVSDLTKERQELETQIKVAEIKLEQKIENAKKQLQNLDATNPLRLVYQSEGDPQRVLPMLVVFFRQLRIWCEKHKIKRFRLLHLIDNLIEEIKTAESK